MARKDRNYPKDDNGQGNAGIVDPVEQNKTGVPPDGEPIASGGDYNVAPKQGKPITMSGDCIVETSFRVNTLQNGKIIKSDCMWAENAEQAVKRVKNK